MTEVDHDEQPTREGITSYPMHARQLWIVANRLVERLETEGKQTAQREQLGLSVILFAAIAVETFLNELAEIAGWFAKDEPRARGVADALEEVERSRGSVRLKFLMAAIALGEPIDKGRGPYQSFDLLFRVRDAIVHLRPYRHTLTATGVDAEPRKLLTALHARKLISDPGAGSFLSTVATAALGKWAVQTASEVVSHIVSLLPEGAFRHQVRFLMADVLPGDAC